ncbi:cyclase family protein [bacterium]|nr:cyclase family protein [bacterium]
MPAKIYDISVDVQMGMPTYPGDAKYKSRKLKSIEQDGYEIHRLTLGNHTGTHVDAPAHFIEGGTTITELPLDILNGRARVVEIFDKEKVGLQEIQKLQLENDFRILLKTRNSSLWEKKKRFQKNYVYLTLDAAKYLAGNDIKLIGFDYLSLEKFGDSEHPVHRYLLGNQVIIVEGLNLSAVEEGEYEMCCLPMKLAGLDGAPARVILRR